MEQIADLTASQATTLNAFWNHGEQRWHTADKLTELGWTRAVAFNITQLMNNSLTEPLEAPLLRHKPLQAGMWAVELQERDGELFYNSIVRAIRVDKAAGTVEGDEYVPALPNTEDGALVCFLQASVVLEDELLELPTDSLLETQALMKGAKGCWTNATPWLPLV